MTIDLTAARTFVRVEGRILEQRVAEALFDGGGTGPVVHAVTAYRNEDGGFGHGLEPDKLAPSSQPLDVEVAFETLVTVGASAPDLVTAACDFLATVSEDGAVPIAFASIHDHPHAAHWSEIPLAAGQNPTASIAGYAHALGVRHPWVDEATEWCFRSLDADGPPPEVHALRCVTRLLEHAPDRARAQSAAAAIAAALPGAPMYQERPAEGEYGLSPLEFAPSPTSFAAALVRRRRDRGQPRPPRAVAAGRRRLADRLGAPGLGRAGRLARHGHRPGPRDPDRLRPDLNRSECADRPADVDLRTQKPSRTF